MTCLKLVAHFEKWTAISVKTMCAYVRLLHSIIEDQYLGSGCSTTSLR